MLSAFPEGNYRFIPGTGQYPFCNGVIADDGYEIVRVTLQQPIAYRAGFDLIAKFLADSNRPRTALCGLELRCSQPYSPEGFQVFNGEYASLLSEWGLYDAASRVGRTARTNVAPSSFPPSEQVLHAFSYTAPVQTPTRPTFVISGVPAARVADSPDATRLRVAAIVQELEARLSELGVTWADTTESVVYAPGEIEESLRQDLIPHLGAAVSNGIRWFPSRAPVAGAEVELGTHGVLRELRIPAA